MQIILRVDDCGWNPEKADDRGLEYFRRWRDAFGIAGLPVYYGFIPTTLGVRELAWLYDNLQIQERVAVHGWDHERGPVSLDRMMVGLEVLRSLDLVEATEPAYIPPFNAYDEQTLRDWRAATPYGAWDDPGATDGNPTFFGGFPDDPQSLNPGGDKPCLVEGNLLHLPAFRPLYGRSHELLARLDDYADVEHPIVATLHVTWEANHFDTLRPLRDKLAPHLVPAHAARDWLLEHGHA